MSVQERVITEFEKRFGTPPPVVVRAPGRVNLIGEHTDYNDGFVMPMAIERAVYIALRPRNDVYVVVHSLDFDEIAEISLLETTPRHNAWAEYIKGVAWALGEAGHTLKGWDGVVAGDVPLGAGLSSSAALELAAARAFSVTSNIEWNAPEMAKISQRAENEWVGMKSGIMDQMISATGSVGNAVLIDCRWLTIDPMPLPAGTVVAVLDTGTRRTHVTSGYNERRQQCEEAARFFHVPALRDVTMEQFIAAQDLLDPLIAKRARHVIGENARTLQAAAAMRAGDANELGRLMSASHTSLRDDFEVSAPAMNIMVEAAQQHPACFGARMTGGGFAGCCVALIREEAAADFEARVLADYQQAAAALPEANRPTLTPVIYIGRAAEGASVLQ